MEKGKAEKLRWLEEEHVEVAVTEKELAAKKDTS